MSVRLAHVGIAVRSIVDARIFYEEVLGLEVESVEEIESEGVKVALLPFPGGEIELLEPLSDDTPVGRYLEKHGEGLHHLSFEVPDVRRSIVAGLEHGGRDGGRGTPGGPRDRVLPPPVHPRRADRGLRRGRRSRATSTRRRRLIIGRSRSF